MPAPALRISQLLTVSAASFDPELAAFKFRRVAPVAIYVDAGKESRRLGREIARDAKTILKELGYGETVEWGTFDGSHIVLNLHKGTVPEDEPTFLQKIGQAKERIAQKAADKLRHFPWKKAGKVAVNGVKVAVAVGGLVTLMSTGPAAPLVVGAFVVPAKVWFAFEATEKSLKVAEGIRDIFVESPPAVQALQQATSQSPPPSPPAPGPNAAATSAADAAQQASAQKIQDKLKTHKEKARRLKPKPH